MAHVLLNHPQVHPGFEKMSSIAVSTMSLAT